MVEWVLESHWEGVESLLPLVPRSSEAERLAAHLDGILLAGEAASDGVERRLREPEGWEQVAAGALVAMALDLRPLYQEIVANLICDDAERRRGVRAALRLSDIRSLREELTRAATSATPTAKASLLDVYAFHRQIPPFAIESLMGCDEPETRRLIVEGLGRLRMPHLVRLFADDTDPSTKRAYWRAMARAGHPDLRAICRYQCNLRTPCHIAIRFLGVVGDSEDLPQLRRLVTSPTTAAPALDALGVLGLAETIPDLISAVGRPETAQSAASAIERITGHAIPRGDSPGPPSHLSDDELDFWSEPGEPDVQAVEKWWRRASFDFQQGQRYQCGRCVSKEPLGVTFLALEDDVRADVYLRERALLPSTTPDWELETWPSRLRNPRWTSPSSN